MEKIIGKIGGLVLLMLLSGMAPLTVAAEPKENIYNSPYVSFSPDGQAWTTNAGDADYEWYENGTRVTTGITSTIRELETGEHYYKVDRTGEIPVGYWEVVHRRGTCIHDAYFSDTWHGIDYGTHSCLEPYYSGWLPYCADCGDVVVNILFYMSEAAAESIDYLTTDEKMSYYYLCPHCTNLEQGVGIPVHECNAISWNRYKVKYESNAGAFKYSGYMEDSIHYYNNATEYEGNPVTPETHLRKNTYAIRGYVFVEWNTEPDGSGTSYADEAEIFNLTTENYRSGEEQGVITLYAQWERSTSTLRIDPAGGAYQNTSDITTLTCDYGTTYMVDNAVVTPPIGYTVSFETNGGEAVDAIPGTQHFVEWSMLQPFDGRFLNGKYFFMAPNGNIDTIKANYTPDAITLPATTRQGYSFGGWYYDEAFSYPAGTPGETIIPDKDMTLYAQWVDLKLTAENNYTANSRNGAVNLSWTQADNQNKSYMLYQSMDGENWTRINTTEDIGTELSVSETFFYTGKAQTYTIPYTGFYTLAAQGAQGGNYGSYAGGKGGSVSGKFWLQKGDVITYTIGGQDGYNGGGAATMYGNGGGMTLVSSGKLGTLLIAGGGGGATELGDGGSGGSSAAILDSGMEGADGGSGGGGGYRGGSAGEVVYHHHKPLETGETQNDCYVKVQGYNLASRDYYSKVYGNEMYSIDTEKTSISCHTADSGNYTYVQVGSLEQLLPTEGAESVSISVAASGWGLIGSDAAYSSMSLGVYNQDGSTLYYQNGGFNGSGTWEPNIQTTYCSDTIKVQLGSSTTGIYIISRVQWNAEDAWLEHSITSVIFGDVIKKICSYEDGEIEKAYPAYGGSNYINTTCCKNYSSKSGICTGNGSFTLESGKIGYLETLELKGVAAPDKAAPDAISLGAVEKEPIRYDRIKITWAEPSDNGTDYYHVAESYLNGSDVPLCRSNITLNTLTTGVCGYYALKDNQADTKVTAANGKGQSLPGITIDLTEEVSYLHVAPVDLAGNVGETTHIRIGSLDGADAVLWKLYTEQLLLDEAENIYPAAPDKTYYVRSDGVTPFTLHYGAYMDGAATEAYQLNHVIFRSESGGATAQNVFTVAPDTIQDAEISIPLNRISYTAADSPYLVRDSYTVVTRKDKNSRLEAVQTFTLPQEASGKEIKVIPVTGADYQGETTYSDHVADTQNGLTLIGDGEAPVISGLDILEDKDLIDRRDGSIYLHATATDALSGVKDFYIRIYNTDNAVEKTYTRSEDGSIRIEITADEPIFSGDFTVTAYAVDNVGNECREEYLTTEFSMETSVERILSPHDPIFKCGESGILTITTWGYADRVEVEFPAAMTALDESLNKVYTYTDTPRYRQQEKLQFMVPLYTPENEAYVIMVHAYKGGKKLEDFPCISTVSVRGSVLDDIRTRIR